MIIHRSNRAEALIEALAEIVAEPCGGVFDPELLVVQGQGMERWIAMELARRRGVWANQQVLTLRGFVNEIALQVLGEQIDPVFDPESMLWSIADALHELEARPAFASIARYLADDEEGRKRIQLARQIAQSFYRYMGYREEMLHAWRKPEGDEALEGDALWQAELFRVLEKRHGTGHLAGGGRALIQRLDLGGFEAGGLPRRLSVFGASTLPRLHFDLLRALSRHCDVHLFLLSPTPHFWGDVATEREARRSLSRGAASQAGGELPQEEDLHLDLGHPLLANFGKLGRDFHAMLVEANELDEGEGDLHTEPADAHVLGTLQRDVFGLEVPGRGGVPRRRFDPRDRSLRIHACHGPMREVEVLCEELIACFEADPALEPHDVVVMTPDIKSYAPYIEAVFGTRARGAEAAARGEGVIPFRIADRWPDPRDEVVDAFFAGVEVVAGRFAAAQVFDLLSRPCVAKRFGLTARDLELIEGWLEGSNIRWGIDAEHRAAEGQPESTANTWRFGLDRLLLGVALDEREEALFEGVRPFGDVEGQRAETLERLIEIERFLVDSRAALSQTHTPARWRELLARFLAGLAIEDDETREQHALLGAALAAVAEQAAHAGYERTVSLASMQEQLQRQLQHARRSTGFLAGGVTFCELVPMRSIPFRVLVLLGMNDGVFPRVDHPPGFDRMAQEPKRGDRSTRDDDRYLFLEALLSARERLIITYVGQSDRDGAVLPPSVAVSELLDIVDESFEDVEDASRPVSESIALQHPLHAFAPRYLDAWAERFPIHSAWHRQLARIEVGRDAAGQRFAGEVTPTGDAAEAVTIEGLSAFYQAPVRAYLRDRLGIQLREAREPIPDREAFALAPLDRSRLGQRLLALREAGHDTEACFERIRATGALPLESAGRLAFDELASEVEVMVAWNARLGARETLEARPFAFECAGVTVTGRFESLTKSGQVFGSFARLGGVSELRAWIWHLAWQVCSDRDPEGFPKALAATNVVGRAPSGGSEAAIRFGEVDDAFDRLAQLIERMREGQRAPLPLFRMASRTYAELARNKGAAAALTAARKNFDLDPWIGLGDLSDPYVELAFRGCDPLDPEADLPGGLRFDELANETFAPLLAAREPIE